MADNLYSTNYSKTLNKVTSKYSQLRNLWYLKHLRDKINCYQKVQQALRLQKKNNSSSITNQNYSDIYYECFLQIQQKQISNSQTLINNINQIQDEYRTCLSDCKDNFTEEDINSKENRRYQCQVQCGTKFQTSIDFVYDNFFRSSVGQEPQYKNCKKN